MHTQLLGVAAATVLGVALVPAIASARVQRVVHLRAGGTTRALSAARPERSSSAEAAALGAYHAYLSSLAAGESVSAARDNQLIQGVDASCSDALSDMASLSSNQLRRSALSDFGDELDGDLDLAYMATSRPALNRFAAALNGLHWPTGGQHATSTRLIAAERRMLDVAPSDLCADANILDAAPLSEPLGTQRFLRRYRAAASDLHGALAGFQSLVSSDETAAEKRLIAQINGLVSQFSDQSGATEQAAVSTVLSDLGITSS